MPMLQMAVTVASLWWLFSREDLRHGVMAALDQADLEWSLAGLAMAGLVVGLGILRWHWFLRIQGVPLGLWENVKLSLIGGFFNLVLIGTVGGDAVRVLYLMKRFPEKRDEALLSVLMDRLCGLPAALAFYATLPISRHAWFEASGISFHALILGALVIGASVIGVMLLFLTAKFGLTHGFPDFLPMRKQAIRFAKALLLFTKHWRLSLAAIGLSFVIHFVYFGCYFAANRAMNAGVSLLDWMTIMPVVDVIATLPVSISGLGVRESLFEELLSKLCATPRELAVLVSMLGFGFTVVWSLVGGVIFPFYRPGSGGERVTFGQVMREARRLNEDN